MSHFSLGRGRAGETRASQTNWTLSMPRPRVPDSWRQISVRRVGTIGLVALIGAVAFCFGMLQTSLFAVQRIDVNGTSHVQRSDIIALSHIKTGKPMISISSTKAVNRIETNAWVESASIRAAWPHVVTINVIERKPIAQAQTAKKLWATIGTNGVILGTSPSPVPGLPDILDISAPAAAGQSLDASTADLINIAQLMPPSLQPHVKQMQNQNGNLRLGLDTNTIVELGDGSDTANKLMAAAAVVSHADAKKLSTLDVRSPNLPVATPVAPPAPAATTPTTAAGSTKTKSSTSTTVHAKKTTTTTVRSTH